MHLISFSKGLIIAATTAFLMACGGSPADKLMGYQEKLLSILEDNKGNLDEAAKEVGEFVAANKADMKVAMADMMKMTEELEKDPAKAAAMMEEFGKKKMELQARMEQLEKEAPGIKDHAGLKAAMADFM